MTQGKLAFATASVALVLMRHPSGARGFPLVALDPTDFFSLAPCRVIDTRLPDGSLGGPALVAGTEELAAFVGAAAGTVHFILDVNGYFAVFNPCAALVTNAQHFDRTGGRHVSGCPGHVPQASAATLCNPSCHACSSSEWDTYRKSLPSQGVGNNIPSHIYWTSDVLGYSGTTNTWSVIPLGSSPPPPNTCPAPLGGFSLASGPNASDTEGNAVLGAGPAGYLVHDPIEYFFGCNSNNFAGTLCCCP